MKKGYIIAAILGAGALIYFNRDKLGLSSQNLQETGSLGESQAGGLGSYQNEGMGSSPYGAHGNTYGTALGTGNNDGYTQGYTDIMPATSLPSSADNARGNITQETTTPTLSTSDYVFGALGVAGLGISAAQLYSDYKTRAAVSKVSDYFGQKNNIRTQNLAKDTAKKMTFEGNNVGGRSSVKEPIIQNRVVQAEKSINLSTSKPQEGIRAPQSKILKQFDAELPKTPRVGVGKILGSALILADVGLTAADQGIRTANIVAPKGYEGTSKTRTAVAIGTGVATTFGAVTGNLLSYAAAGAAGLGAGQYKLLTTGNIKEAAKSAVSTATRTSQAGRTLVANTLDTAVKNVVSRVDAPKAKVSSGTGIKTGTSTPKITIKGISPLNLTSAKNQQSKDVNTGIKSETNKQTARVSFKASGTSAMA